MIGVYKNTFLFKKREDTVSGKHSIHPAFLLETNQFKTTTISLRFIAPFDPTSVNERALLPAILLSGTKKFPSRQRLQLEYDLLYGSEINGRVTRYGDTSIITFNCSIIEPSYLDGSFDIYGKIVELLDQIIHHPKTYKSKFVKRIVEEEKRMMKEGLESIYNDKIDYAYYRFKQLMFANERYATFETGGLATLPDVSVDSMMKSYQSMIQTDAVEIALSGSPQAKELLSSLEAVFAKPWPNTTFTWIDREISKRTEPQFIKETLPIKQAKINIGYRTHTYYNDKDVFSMFVFNAMFGDYEQSMLFQTVREKLHLAYYVQSSYNHNKGYLAIMAGVDPTNEQITIDAIHHVLDTLKNGDFSDDDFQLAKSFLLEQQRRGMDSPSTLLQRHFNYNHLLGMEYDPTLFAKQLWEVSKEDVIRTANKLTLDTIYILSEDAHE